MIKLDSAFIITISVSLLLGFPHPGKSEIEDPIPSLPRGDVSIHLSSFTTGMPVQEEFITPVFTQRVGPTDLAEIPNGSGSLIVTNYGGVAFRLDQSGLVAPRAFLNLSSPESPSFNSAFEFGGAHGLTTIAFHPGFSDITSQGYRKFYTVEPETSGSGVPDFVQSVVAGDHHQEAIYEYTLESVESDHCTSACAASKRELLRVQQPGWHHNLADLLFDSEGLLYVASADGNVAGRTPPMMSDNSQLLTNIFGKILRIDPFGDNSGNGRYGIPAGNPFVNVEGDQLAEIYAYGLRNPYRIEFDRRTGQMYASETGEEQIESVERIVSGGNFGWNTKEGSYLYDRTTKIISVDNDSDGDGRGDFAQQHGLIDPVLEYDRDEGRAIVGALPYRGNSIPNLQGQIIFADFSGGLFHGDPGSGQTYRMLLDESEASLPFNIHSVNQDSSGNAYLLGIARQDNNFDGVVVRLHATPTTSGDFNGNGKLDAADIDLLSAAVREGSQANLFDLSKDGKLDETDRLIWLGDLKKTILGDSNLDGRWNSTDFVVAFQFGQYQDSISQNSNWSAGDWNGDGDFDSSDIVAAFQNGGYEPGLRAVPEPSCHWLGHLAISLLAFGLRKNKHCPPRH
ncbi:MAG: hypothetical protein GY768_17620 [Planctomycetaceae bacterium]|nr:hypothetical protein [Planctomycetaceae bacterium]